MLIHNKQHHLCTCTTHSGVTRSHDWVVDQLTDLFLTTHKVKTQHVIKNRGRRCGDVELTPYLPNTVDPVSLVLDLRITHDRFRSSSDLNLNRHLHYPNDIGKSLNETVSDKIRKYRPVCLITVHCMPIIDLINVFYPSNFEQLHLK